MQNNNNFTFNSKIFADLNGGEKIVTVKSIPLIKCKVSYEVTPLKKKSSLTYLWLIAPNPVIVEKLLISYNSVQENKNDAYITGVIEIAPAKAKIKDVTSPIVMGPETEVSRWTSIEIKIDKLDEPVLNFDYLQISLKPKSTSSKSPIKETPASSSTIRNSVLALTAVFNNINQIIKKG